MNFKARFANEYFRGALLSQSVASGADAFNTDIEFAARQVAPYVIMLLVQLPYVYTHKSGSMFNANKHITHS